MKISVVIPALNEERYIAIALEALRRQNFPRKDFEIIVADNKSSDNTVAIAKKLADKVVSEKRKGTNFAREAGYKASKYEIVAFLDADCIPPAHWLKTIDQAFSEKKNHNLGLLAGAYLYYDLPHLTRSAVFFADQHVVPVFATTLKYLTGRVAPICRGGNMAIARKALKAIGGLNTDLVFFGDDVDTAIRIFKKGFNVRYEPKFVVKSSGRRYQREGQMLNFKYTSAYLAAWWKS